MTENDQKVIRAPIACILGHIDHGKTSLLDYIRGTVVQQREAAGITQHIGASFFPIDDLKTFLSKSKKEFAEKRINLPGLLIVDTPGHAAFMNLRKRGGAVADIAILVVDVTSGTQPITWESVRILRERKTPFDLSDPFMAAGGGIAEIRKPHSIPPQSGPTPQGLLSIKNNVKRY